MIIDPRYNFVFENGELLHPATFAQRVVITLPQKPLADIISEAYPQKAESQRQLGNINHVSVVHTLMRLSNIDELQAYLLTGNSPTESLGRYILIRRCLRMISQEYPELRNAVKKMIHAKYRPSFRMGAIVIPDNFLDLVREVSPFKITDTREKYDQRLLEMVLHQQTDYDYFVGAGMEVNDVRIRCCEAITATYNGYHVGNTALREAQRIRLLRASYQRSGEVVLESEEDDPFL